MHILLHLYKSTSPAESLPPSDRQAWYSSTHMIRWNPSFLLISTGTFTNMLPCISECRILFMSGHTGAPVHCDHQRRLKPPVFGDLGPKGWKRNRSTLHCRYDKRALREIKTLRGLWPRSPCMAAGLLRIR